MIDFEFEFLICFTKAKPPLKLSSKKRNQQKSKSLKNRHVTSKTHDSSSEINAQISSDTIQCYNIKYCIFEDVLPVVEITVVVCESDVVVFLYEESYKQVNTVNYNDLIWAFFKIVHRVPIFDDSQLILFKDSKITFLVSKKAKCASDSLKSWFEKVVGLRSFNINNDETYPPGLENSSEQSDSKKREDVYRVNGFENNSIGSFLKIIPLRETFSDKIREISSLLYSNMENEKDIVKEKTNRASKGKNYEKGKNLVSQSIELVRLHLNSEGFVAGKSQLYAEQIVTESNVNFISLFAKSSKVMTEEQDTLFLPIIINIKSVEDLPFDYLKTLNLKNIFAHYEFSNIVSNMTTERFHMKAKDIFMDETKVFFLSGPEESEQFSGLKSSRFKLQEALLTRRLVVKLYGELSSYNLSSEACLLGSKPFDDFISTMGHEMFLKYESPSKEEPALLGSAWFKLITLLDGVPLIETTSVLTSAPVSTWDFVCDWDLLTDGLSEQTERIALLNKFYSRGKIPDSILLENCTRVKINVSSACQLSHFTLNDILLFTNVYHRSVVILTNRKCAYNVRKLIESFNRSSSIKKQENNLEEFNIKPDSSSLSFNRKEDVSETNTFLDRTITGFFLESDEEYILVIESYPHIIYSTNTIITNLILPKKGKIIYDSTIFFTHRIYDHFFNIRLKKPMKTLLTEASFYLAKKISDSSIQALLRLDILRVSPTLDCITANQLFPSYEQLINFNLSFGVATDANGSMCLTEASAD